MLIPERQRWMLVAGATTALVAPLTERALGAAWERASGEEPPKDAAARDVDWTLALVWGITAAVAVAVAEVVVRRGTAVAWKEVTGHRPPAPKRKKRRR
jgi:hypothetical protein